MTMKRNAILSSLTVVAALLASTLLVPSRLLAHCDGMDGPVVKVAQHALETGDVNAVLIWVQNNDEGAVRKAFKEALAVRKLSSEARALADMYFFETVVRLHRAGEGAPYTGLKPAGRDLGPAIPAADNALERGSAEQLLGLLRSSVREGVRDHFKETLVKKDFKDRKSTRLNSSHH